MKALSERQESILLAALDITAKRGIQQLTTKNLARAVGVSEPALYRHFKSKHDVLVSIISYYRQILIDIFDQSPNTGVTSIDWIGIFYKKLLSSFMERPELSMVVFTEELFRHDNGLFKEALSVIDLMHERILCIIKDGVRKKEIRTDVKAKHLSWMIMGTMRMLIARWRMSGYSFNLAREGSAVFESIRKTVL